MRTYRINICHWQLSVKFPFLSLTSILACKEKIYGFVRKIVNVRLTIKQRYEALKFVCDASDFRSVTQQKGSGAKALRRETPPVMQRAESGSKERAFAARNRKEKSIVRSPLIGSCR